jgi:hypothetical protein
MLDFGLGIYFSGRMLSTHRPWVCFPAPKKKKKMLYFEFSCSAKHLSTKEDSEGMGEGDNK